MKFCTVCGAELSKDEVYCSKCGSYINKKAKTKINSEQEKFCAICGEPVGENNYCIKCGHKIDDAVEERIIDKLYNEANRTGFTVLACIGAGLLIINLFNSSLNFYHSFSKFDRLIDNVIDISSFISNNIDNKYNYDNKVYDEDGFEITQDEFDLSGMNVDGAISILQNNGVPYQVTYISSKNHAKDIVVSIDPSVRSVLDGNEPLVNVYVSSGIYGSYSNNGNYQALYQINITDVIRKLNIRSSPTLELGEQNIVGDTTAGEVFNVYESLYNEGYTWYRIDDYRWIADDGTWAQVDPYCNADRLWNPFEIEYYAGDATKNIYDSPNDNSYNRTVVGTLYLGDIVTCYYEFDSNQYRWYKIGANMWIKDHFGDEIWYR